LFIISRQQPSYFGCVARLFSCAYDCRLQVCELAERYAPDPRWFIGVLSEVFALGGDHVDEQLAHNLMRLVAEQEASLQRAAVGIYLEQLQRPKLPEILLRVCSWEGRVVGRRCKGVGFVDSGGQSAQETAGLRHAAAWSGCSASSP
jgi:hypothetical protein